MRHQSPHTARFIDEDTDHDKLYEVTLNTVQDRFFFIPSPLLNLLIIGVLAYAQAKTGLRICYATFLSTHAHILIRTKNAEQVANFFCLSNSQIAKEVQRLVDWTGGIFADGYTMIAITDEPQAQEERLRYLMSQGTKEGLCPHPTKWPGVQSATALLTGTMTMLGRWINRTAQYDLEYLYERTAALKAANRKRNRGLPVSQRKSFRGKKRRRPKLSDYSEDLHLELSPLPCWDHLSKKEVRDRAREMAASIVEEHKDTIDRLPPHWRDRVTDQSRATQRPRKRRPPSVRPKVHAASKEEWILWIKNWENWINLFERASQRLRSGIKEALDEFPLGAFIPTGCYLAKARPPPPT